MVALTTGHDNARAFLTGLLDRRTELGTHVVACHGEQIMCRLSRRYTQKAVRRSHGIQAFVFAIYQYRRRCIGLDDQASTKIGENGLARGSAALAWTSKASYAVGSAHRETKFSRSAATNVPIELPRPGAYLKAAVDVAGRLGIAK